MSLQDQFPQPTSLPTGRGVEDIPAFIRDAFTPQMRRVVEHQLERKAAQPAADGEQSADPLARAKAMRAEYRDERAFWNEGGPDMVRTDDLRMSAAGVDVPVRIHRPTDAELLPAIVYIHGGGFVVGDLDTHDRIMRVLADVSQAAVVGLDYSLAPEATFPQALHECAGVVAQLAAEGPSYGIDPGTIALAGDSGGAVLSLGTALLLRDAPQDVPGLTTEQARNGFAAIRALLLYYGAHGLTDSVSGRLYGGFWDDMGADELDHFVTDAFDSPEDRTSPYYDHLSADLAAPLPPAYVIGAALDPLADSARALGTVLENNGQDVRWRIVPGVLHSFLHFGRMLDEANEVLAGGALFARSRFESVR